MSKPKDIYRTGESRFSASNKNDPTEGRKRIVEIPKKTVSGLWPLLFLAGLLLLVFFMHWLKTH